MKNNQIVINLKKANQLGIISKQEYLTLKGQVLSGEEKSAAKGFMTIIKRIKRAEGIESI